MSGSVVPILPCDLPFGLPPGSIEVSLDLPAPPSVNRTRRVDWDGQRAKKKWAQQADIMVLAARCRTRQALPRKIACQFEVTIVLSERHTHIDIDNGVKNLIDYLRRIELIVDDGPKYLRRLIVQFGDASMGCRVTLRSLHG
jgi:Holliday junction resolvase RusA-like endonuclease